MRKFLLALVAVVLSGHAYGAVVACATAFTAADTFTHYGAGATNGCFQADKSFTTLAVGAGAACTAGAGCTTSANGNTDIWATGTLSALSSPGLGGTVTANLAPSSNIWTLTGSGTDTAALTYVVQSNETCPGGAGLHCAIGGNVGLAPTGSIVTTTAGGATETITVTENFCINAATTAGCLAANSGTIEGEITINGSTSGTFATFTFLNCLAGASVGTCNGGVTGSSIALTGFFNEIAVSNSISLTRVNGDFATLDLTNIANSFQEFEETPEPSTFALFGTALAGLGFLRLRSKKS
jgi:hypothetical protein